MIAVVVVASCDATKVDNQQVVAEIAGIVVGAYHDKKEVVELGQVVVVDLVVARE